MQELNKQKPFLLFIVGPTASGKTSLALDLASEIDAEIINADSRQVVSGMDIGTNKEPLRVTGHSVQSNERSLLQYHLNNTQIPAWIYNTVSPNQHYDVAQFVTDTEAVIADVLSRGKKIIVCGGTGLYVDALVKGYNLAGGGRDEKLRSKLQNKTAEELLELVKEQVPDAAAKLNQSDRSNPVRLIRILERNSNPIQKSSVKYQSEILYPEFNREQLYEKINTRAELMFSEGLVSEVQLLIDQGFKDSKFLQGIGYKQVLDFLNKEIDYKTMVDNTKTAHRQYASRQITWFEGKGRGYKLNKCNFSELDTVHSLVERIYQKSV